CRETAGRVGVGGSQVIHRQPFPVKSAKKQSEGREDNRGTIFPRLRSAFLCDLLAQRLRLSGMPVLPPQKRTAARVLFRHSTLDTPGQPKARLIHPCRFDERAPCAYEKYQSQL